MILRLDAVVFVLTERLSHAVQRFSGTTCYRQAYWTMVAWQVGNALRVADYWLPTLLKPSSSVADLMICFLVFCIAAFRASVFRRADRDFTGDVLPLAAHILRNDPISKHIRMLMVFVLAMFWPFIIVEQLIEGRYLDLFVSATGVCLPLSYYLADVVPLPRSGSKVSDWIASFRAGLQVRVPLGRTQ